jgi:hypothetical protein
MVNLAKDNPYRRDFNILRFQQKKNNGRFDNYWSFLFNAVFGSLNLRKVNMLGRKFTWEKLKISLPTYEKLDRVLMDTKWKTKYPMVTVHAQEHIEALSDHAPLFLGIFFKREYINIPEIPITPSLCTPTKCPKDITDAHNQKNKKEEEKRKVHQFLVAEARTTTKENTQSPYSPTATPRRRKECTRTIVTQSKILGFHP